MWASQVKAAGIKCTLFKTKCYLLYILKFALWGLLLWFSPLLFERSSIDVASRQRYCTINLYFTAFEK